MDGEVHFTSNVLNHHNLETIIDSSQWNDCCTSSIRFNAVSYRLYPHYKATPSSPLTVQRNRPLLTWPPHAHLPSPTHIKSSSSHPTSLLLFPPPPSPSPPPSPPPLLNSSHPLSLPSFSSLLSLTALSSSRLRFSPAARLSARCAARCDSLSWGRSSAGTARRVFCSRFRVGGCRVGIRVRFVWGGGLGCWLIGGGGRGWGLREGGE